MEKLSTVQHKFPCTYQKSGCTEMIPAVSKSDHQNECPYGTYNCPFQCPGKFTRKNLVLHVKQEHNRMFRKCSARTQIIKIENYDVTKDYAEVIMAHEEVFLHTIRIINGIWYFLLQYIGPEQDIGSFSYKLCLDEMEDDVACIKISHWCRSINEDVNEIYQSCKCIMLPAEVICRAINDGDLSFYFKIVKLQ
jgi:hypothetical protein